MSHNARFVLLNMGQGAYALYNTATDTTQPLGPFSTAAGTPSGFLPEFGGASPYDISDAGDEVIADSSNQCAGAYCEVGTVNLRTGTYVQLSVATGPIVEVDFSGLSADGTRVFYVAVPRTPPSKPLSTGSAYLQDVIAP